jgi:replicative DNA helicase
MSAADLLKNLQARLSNVKLEKEMISHCINFPEDQIEILTNLDAKFFSDPDCQETYRIIYDMFKDKMNISNDSVLSMIPLKAKTSDAERIANVVKELSGYILKDTVFNSMYLIKEFYRNRIIYNEILVKVNMMFTENVPIEEIIEHIAQSVMSVETKKKEEKTKTVVENVVDTILQSMQFEVGLDIGLTEFDVTYGGIKPDRYITIGAESGAGKTAIVIDMIERLCVRHSEKIAILFFSMEMSESRIIRRLISRKTGLSIEKLEQKLKRLSPENKALVKSAGDAIARYPLQIIYDTMTTHQMQLRARKFAMENPDKHLIIILDHIGLVSGSTSDMRVNTIQASTACKNFCRDYNATTFVLTQFTKEIDSSEQRKNFHMPHMGYIMESGRIRQDSDIVMLLWRPETRFVTIPYAGNPTWPTSGKMIILNEKNRDGQAPTHMIVAQDVATNTIKDQTNIFQ